MQSKSEENIAPASTEVSVAPVAAEKPVEAPAATTALAAEGQTDGETTGQTKVEAPMSTTEQTEESTDNASQTPATKDDPAAAPGKINAQQEKAQTALDDNKAEDATKAMASASISDATAAGVGARPSAPLWPETGPEHPLTQFYAALPDLTSEASHSEVYGIPLSHENPFHTKLILQKFLRANANDLGKAKEQLLKTLKWRKEYDPVGAAAATYDKDRFEGLGYIIEVEGVPGSDGARADGKDVITFNVYGAVKDNKKTFGDMDGYVLNP